MADQLELPRPGQPRPASRTAFPHTKKARASQARPAQPSQPNGVPHTEASNEQLFKRLLKEKQHFLNGRPARAFQARPAQPSQPNGVPPHGSFKMSNFLKDF